MKPLTALSIAAVVGIITSILAYPGIGLIPIWTIYLNIPFTIAMRLLAK